MKTHRIFEPRELQSPRTSNSLSSSPSTSEWDSSSASQGVDSSDRSSESPDTPKPKCPRSLAISKNIKSSQHRSSAKVRNSEFAEGLKWQFPLHQTLHLSSPTEQFHSTEKPLNRQPTRRKRRGDRSPITSGANNIRSRRLPAEDRNNHRMITDSFSQSPQFRQPRFHPTNRARFDHSRFVSNGQSPSTSLNEELQPQGFDHPRIITNGQNRSNEEAHMYQRLDHSRIVCNDRNLKPHYFDHNRIITNDQQYQLQYSNEESHIQRLDHYQIVSNGHNPSNFLNEEIQHAQQQSFDHPRIITNGQNHQFPSLYEETQIHQHLDQSGNVYNGQQLQPQRLDHPRIITNGQHQLQYLNEKPQIHHQILDNYQTVANGQQFQPQSLDHPRIIRNRQQHQFQTIDEEPQAYQRSNHSQVTPKSTNKPPLSKWQLYKAKKKTISKRTQMIIDLARKLPVNRLDYSLTINGTRMRPHCTSRGLLHQTSNHLQALPSDPNLSSKVKRECDLQPPEVSQPSLPPFSRLIGIYFTILNDLQGQCQYFEWDEQEMYSSSSRDRQRKTVFG